MTLFAPFLALSFGMLLLSPLCLSKFSFYSFFFLSPFHFSFIHFIFLFIFICFFLFSSPFPSLSDLILKWWGFEFFWCGSVGYWRKPPSPPSFSSSFSSSSPSPSPTTPLIFTHGLGVGIFPYLSLVSSLVSLWPEREIYLLSLPWLAMRPIEAIPSCAVVVSSVLEMIDR